MNEQGWAHDKTPYLIFACNKCHQFSYVKLNQKTKRCLRCGRVHQVNKIISTGETVSGISNALELVKKKQGKLKGDSYFKVESSFEILPGRENITKKQNGQDHKNEQQNISFSDVKEENFAYEFKEMLHELAKMYKSFPKYLIYIMAENYSIPKQEVSNLLRVMMREGFLNYSKRLNRYFLSK